jgi:hypothetical protein
MELRSVPGASDVRVIVGDTHGDHVGMLQALRRVGAIDDRGVRAAGYWLCHVGDVIHAGHGVQHDDVVCLELALGLFDCLLYGNHETPFAVGIGSFVGQNPQLDCQALLDASVRDRRWLAATAVDGYVVCHAGLHPLLLLRDSRVFEPLRGTEALKDPLAVAAAINSAFETRVQSPDPEPLFDWVGPVRSSRTIEPCGGIFWCDWTELMTAERKPGQRSQLRQIVGHTPRRKGPASPGRQVLLHRRWCGPLGIRRRTRQASRRARLESGPRRPQQAPGPTGAELVLDGPRSRPRTPVSQSG